MSGHEFIVGQEFKIWVKEALIVIKRTKIEFVKDDSKDLETLIEEEWRIVSGNDKLGANNLHDLRQTHLHNES